MALSEAYVETLKDEHQAIEKVIQAAGFRVRSRCDKNSLHFEGEGEAIAKLLFTLRHQFPRGYVQGWASPKK